MALTEAHKKANKKWDEKNKARKQYLNKRSLAKSFIRKLATDEDIEELSKLIEERKLNE
ncbi:hypothetical protein [Apilactobacillus xinyiensis]|uniref:hypothetical protein n=1 Tax=Apilactobacillus xinyiensis TaxID=2841032 RepID=UPI003364C5D7